MLIFRQGKPMFPVFVEELICLNDVLLCVNSSVNFLIYRFKLFLCHAEIFQILQRVPQSFETLYQDNH